VWSWGGIQETQPGHCALEENRMLVVHLHKQETTGRVAAKDTADFWGQPVVHRSLTGLRMDERDETTPWIHSPRAPSFPELDKQADARAVVQVHRAERFAGRDDQ
jgi:hypothetical protein